MSVQPLPNPERDRLRKALRHIRYRAMDGGVASEATDDPAMALWEIDMILREIDGIACDALRQPLPDAVARDAARRASQG